MGDDPVIWVVSILAGVAGSILLRALYSGFKTRWPESYAHSDSELDAHHRRGVGRFVLVRMGPVVLVAYASTALVSEADGRPGVAAVALAVSHVLATDGQILSGSWRRLVPSRIVYHVVAVLGVVLACVIGLLLSSVWPDLAPSLEEVNTALWTALLTALIGALYLRSTSSRRADQSLLLDVKVAVGPGLWSAIPEIAIRHETDPQLIRAVVGAECLQRPAWFRRIERHWPGASTFGIAQVPGRRLMTDRESIEILCGRFAGYRPERETWGEVASKWDLECHLENHNSSEAFMSDCLSLMKEMSGGVVSATNEEAADGYPSLIVSQVRREGRAMLIGGTLFHDGATGVAAFHESEVEALDEYSLPGGIGRRRWVLKVPLNFREVRVQPSSSTGAHSSVDSISLTVNQHDGWASQAVDNYPY